MSDRAFLKRHIYAMQKIMHKKGVKTDGNDQTWQEGV